MPAGFVRAALSALCNLHSAVLSLPLALKAAAGALCPLVALPPCCQLLQFLRVDDVLFQALFHERAVLRGRMRQRLSHGRQRRGCMPKEPLQRFSRVGHAAFVRQPAEHFFKRQPFLEELPTGLIPLRLRPL